LEPAHQVGRLASDRSPAVLEAAALAGVMTLACTLRLGWPGVNSFGYDEARVSQLALGMARNGDFAATGMLSSTGIPNFPATIWTFAIPYAISTDPLVASLFTGFLNILGVLCLWYLVRQCFGKWEALVSATLFAASPYAVFYSRAVWSQDLLAPLATLWALLGVLAVRRDSAFALAGHVFLAGIAFQIHYAGACLLIPTLWLVLRHRLWRAWRALALGALPAVLSALPFAITLLRDWAGLRDGIASILAAPPQTDLTGLRQLVEMATGRGWEWFLLGDSWQWPEPLSVSLCGASALVGLLLVAGSYSLGRAFLARGRTDAAASDAARVLAGLLPVWALSAALLFARHSTPAYHQYQLAALPALFVVAGAAVRVSTQRRWRVLIWTLALAAAAVQTYAMADGLSVVAGRLAPGGIGTPLAYPRAVAVDLHRAAEVVVHAHDDEATYCGDVAAFDVLLWNTPHRFVDGRSALLIPPRPDARLFFTFDDLPAWQIARTLNLAGELTVYPRREGEPPYVGLSVTDNWPGNLPQTEKETLDNGAVLRTWTYEREGSRLRVMTWWLITQESERQYHQFHHLYGDGDAEPVAIHDVPVSSSAWRTGDTLIVWADFDMPPDEVVWLETGMYVWPDLRRSPVLNREGDPLAPIRLGPIEAERP